MFIYETEQNRTSLDWKYITHDAVKAKQSKN